MAPRTRPAGSSTGSKATGTSPVTGTVTSREPLGRPLSNNVAFTLQGLQVAGVPRGQLEAARSIGLGPRDVFRSVVFPQALRSVYPPVINQFIQVVLGSSLVSQIALPELTNTAQTINSHTLLTMHIFTIALVLYLVLSNVIAVLADVVARRSFKPPLYPSGPRRRVALFGRIGQMVRGG